MPQELLVTLLVLLAAFLHAVWNALVKSNADRTLTLGLLSSLSIVVGLALIGFVPVPPPAVRGYLAVAVGFHLAFKICLLQAYRAGDLSHVYPLARGSAPLVVALLSGWVGERLHGGEVWGVLLISLGVFTLTFEFGLPGRQQRAPVGFALLTGLSIAGYTMVDGMGARTFGHPLAYTVWLFLIDGTIFFAGVLVLRWRQLAQAAPLTLLVPIGAGFISMAGYAIIVWALSLGAMAPVAALRETGVIFAALIGTFVLKEPLGRRRIFAAACMAAGVVAIGWG
jgi:drug/metabolite transporter (DMT)-like permease